VAVGDVNGDGHADIITGAGPTGGPNIQVHDGTDFAHLLYNFQVYSVFFTGGVYVAAGDVNGDGKADMIAGAGPTGGPNVVVYSGADGSVLANFNAYGPFFQGGVRVAAADVNGDGHADIITAAGPTGGPNVVVFDGSNPGNPSAVLDNFFAYSQTFLDGVFVGGL
jgi:hypothetical protein